ncbi:coiled-coil domain-containing protein [Streptomyces sp. NPDC048650]|uniref:coiled-coil domain-containing protein n=1 Tax=Streptomyces sp. NPDC048650 TaxID=3365583 RepID=UPI0037165DED
MSRRILPWVCTLGLIGVVALTLPSSVLADPSPVPAGSMPGGSMSTGWEDTKPSDGRPSGTRSSDPRPPGTGPRGVRPPDDRPTPGSTDTGTSDTWIPDTGEGELGRVTEGMDGDDPDGPDGMPDTTATTGGTDEPSDTGPAGSSSAPSAAPSAAGEQSPVALLQQLQSLYRQSEETTRAYRATEDDLRAVQRQSDSLGSQLAQARAQLAGGRADAGRLARLQYQGSRSPASSYLRVLLARNPQQAMDTRHLIREAARDQRAAVTRLTAGEKRADTLATRAHDALNRQQALTDRARALRETSAHKLKEVEALLASLSPQQLTELGRLEAQATDGARRDLPAEA